MSIPMPEGLMTPDKMAEASHFSKPQRSAVVRPKSEQPFDLQAMLEEAKTMQQQGLATLRTSMNRFEQEADESETGESQDIQPVTDLVLIEVLTALHEARKSGIVADIQPEMGLGMSGNGEQTPEVAFLPPAVFEILNAITAIRNLTGRGAKDVLKTGQSPVIVDHLVPEDMVAALKGRTKMPTIYGVSGDIIQVVGDFITNASKDEHGRPKGRQGVVVTFGTPADDPRLTGDFLVEVIISDGPQAEGANNRRIVISGKDVVDKYHGNPMVYVPRSAINRLGGTHLHATYVFKRDKDKTFTKNIKVTANLDVAMAEDFMTQPKYQEIQEQVAVLSARKERENDIANGGTLTISVKGRAGAKLFVTDSVQDPTPGSNVAYNKEVPVNASEIVKVKDGKVTLSLDKNGNAANHAFYVEVFAGGQKLTVDETADGQVTFVVKQGEAYDVRLEQVTGEIAKAGDEMRVELREWQTQESLKTFEVFKALVGIKRASLAGHRWYGLDANGNRHGGYAYDSDLGLKKGDRIDTITPADLKTALARKGNEAKQVAWATNRMRNAAERSKYLASVFELISAVSGRTLEQLYAEVGTELIKKLKDGSLKKATLPRGTKLASVSAGSQESVTDLKLAGNMQALMVTLNIQGFELDLGTLACRNLVASEARFKPELKIVREQRTVLGRAAYVGAWFETHTQKGGERTTYQPTQTAPLPYAPVPVEVNQNVSGNSMEMVNRMINKQANNQNNEQINNQTQQQLQEQQQQQLQQMWQQQVQQVWNSLTVVQQLELINKIINDNKNVNQNDVDVHGFRGFDEWASAQRGADLMAAYDEAVAEEADFQADLQWIRDWRDARNAERAEKSVSNPVLASSVLRLDKSWVAIQYKGSNIDGVTLVNLAKKSTEQTASFDEEVTAA